MFVDFVTLCHLSFRALVFTSNRVDLLTGLIMRPMITTLFLATVARSVGGDVELVVVGAALAGMIFQTVSSSVQSLGNEQSFGTIDELLTAQLPLVLIVASRALAQVGLAVVTLVAATTAGQLVFWFVLDPGQMIVVVAAGAVGALSLAFAGMVWGVVALRIREIGLAFGLATGIFYLLSGAVIPLRLLPTPLEVIANVSPLRWAVHAARAALGEGDGIDIVAGLLIEAGLGLAFLTIGTLALSRHRDALRRAEIA